MKNKGLLHPGVTYVTNEEPLQTHMIRRGATYYMRRLVPEELRSYFLTKTGQPRTEFTVSLRTKEHATAKERLEKECTKVTALFKEARRKLEAGIPHRTTGAVDRVMAAYDRWQDEQVALQEVVFQRDMEQEATEADEDAALARDMSRPYDRHGVFELRRQFAVGGDHSPASSSARTALRPWAHCFRAYSASIAWRSALRRRS